MGEPKPKPPRPDEPPTHGPHPDDVDLLEGADDVMDVDGEGHVRWLETGEGEPWPERSS